MKDYARILRRLAPLYVASFFHGFVLWYVVEKLYMRSIGFDDAGIGLMVAAYSAMMLICETPSGILADRWSRKGVLVVASVLLAIASVICGISQEPVLYVIGALVWGVFFSLYSGTYDSIIYDTVKEETGEGTLYDKFFGRFRVIDSVALVAGALIGGTAGQLLGLQAPFFLTLPLALGAIIALARFKEPQLHHQGRHDSTGAHVKETFKLLLGQPKLLPLVALIVTLILASIMLYEFNQLWFIALNVPPIWFGPGMAASLAASGVAGYVVGKIGTHKKAARRWAHIAFVASAFALIFVPNPLAVAAAHFVFASCGVGLTILGTRDLHDVLPSRVRAGASSALSTLARVFTIPASLLFGMISTSINIFAAAWIMVALAIVAFGFEVSRRRIA